MPPQRSPKKAWFKPAGKVSGKTGKYFDPGQEGIDEDADEAQRAFVQEDPYHRYRLKTGKHRNHTLKHVNDIPDHGYLEWMLTKPKACRDVDDEHIVKKGLLQWVALTGGPAPDRAAETTDISSATSVAGPSTADPAAASDTSRFKDAAGRSIWIDGFDIIGLFHMTEQQLKRHKVKPVYSTPFDRRYRTNRYPLEAVHAAAVATTGCPIDETPHQALERYLAKVQKCGQGFIMRLPGYCECSDCEKIRCGPTDAGTTFWLKQLKARAEEMQRKHDQIEDDYIWAMNH